MSVTFLSFKLSILCSISSACQFSHLKEGGETEGGETVYICKFITRLRMNIV